MALTGGNYRGVGNAASGMPMQTNLQTPDANVGRDRITQALMNIQNPPPATYQPQAAGMQSLGSTPIGSSGTPTTPPTAPMPGASIPGMPIGMNPLTNPTAMGMTGTGTMPQQSPALAGMTGQQMQQPPYPQPPGLPM